MNRLDRYFAAPRFGRVLWLPFLALLAGACGADSSSAPPAEPEDFISGLPYAEGNAASPQASGAPADNAAAGPATQAADGAEGAAANRAIAEADIIQRDGDTLYALSRYTGLSIVDIANPAKLKMLGRYDTAGNPFEMYIEDGVMLVMYTDYGHYAYDEASQSSNWVSSSRVEAIDVTSPAQPKQVGVVDVPGSIADSRKVGDILYVVTHEYGCWGCSIGPSTVIASLTLKDLANIKAVDELRFEQDPNTWQQAPSIAVTDQRVYIGNRVYGDVFFGGESGEVSATKLPKGTIQAVDISDPAGDLVEGAAIRINGQIDNRWQMDEHAGVLRVLSQYSSWSADAVPRLETFKVVSSKEITKLGELELKLPRPEVLQSVRFDGDRAFAITFERTDPLFTFDLSDPAKPIQVGELEIPGWVYHMEPRGDRLYGVGFDNAAGAGSLHVSLFDVSNLAAPRMIDRVNFGGDWASLAEDQDRIHKSFKLFDEDGLIVVPFSGWSNTTASDCGGKYQSGVQLIDFSADALTLRGVAPQVGEARRAFVHRDHLFGTGDDAVQTFDISDRDAPKRVDTLEVALNVSTVRVIGDRVLRFGNDWWTERAVLDVVPAAQAGEPTAGTPIDLSELVKDDRDVCKADHWQYSYWGNVYTQGNYAYVERHVETTSGSAQTSQLKFFVLDLTAGNVPAFVGEFGADLSQSGNSNSHEYFSGTLLTDSALLVGRTRYSYTQADDSQTHDFSYDIFDIRDGKAPVFVKNFKVPAAVVQQGWGRPVMGCGLDYGWGWGGYGGYGDSQGSLVSGDFIASTHSEDLKDGSARARMYLDRLDVSDPANPKMLTKINVPGEAIHYDHKSGTLVTLEYDVQVENISAEKCWAGSTQNRYFTGEECRSFKRSLNVLNIADDQATRVARTQLDAVGADDAWYMASLSVTNERVFVSQFRPESSTGGEQTRENAVQVFTTAKLEELGTITERAGWFWGDLRARGTRAFSNRDGGELSIYDASDATKVPSVTQHPLKGWGCEALEVRGNTAYCAEGKKGVHMFKLD